MVQPVLVRTTKGTEVIHPTSVSQELASHQILLSGTSYLHLSVCLSDRSYSASSLACLTWSLGGPTSSSRLRPSTCPPSHPTSSSTFRAWVVRSWGRRAQMVRTKCGGVKKHARGCRAQTEDIRGCCFRGVRSAGGTGSKPCALHENLYLMLVWLGTSHHDIMMKTTLDMRFMQLSQVKPYLPLIAFVAGMMPGSPGSAAGPGGGGGGGMMMDQVARAALPPPSITGGHPR
jgi:hypothetical protein